MASIYSNSILLLNPIQKIKHLQAIKPITFSLAYMPVKVEDEGKMLFSCDTEDRSGGKDWACLIVSKARFVRRKIKIDNDKSWTGLMDLTTERDYIILLNKKL
jgi:expansin (peptidoglycan-binding protein)